MIATIILAILLGTGGLLYLANLGSNTPTIIQTLTVPLTIALENLFTILGYLAPLLIAIIPLYLTLKTRKEPKHLAFAAAYGLVLYTLAIYTGLDNRLNQAITTSIFQGSTLNLVTTSLGAYTHWITATLTGVMLWGTGLILTLFAAFLDTLITVGEAAKTGKKTIQRTKHTILRQIGERNNDP